MTTSVRIHVNGRYRAHVRQDLLPPVIVEGNYDGSPNPTGEATFNLRGGHPTRGTFEVVEEYLDAPPGPPPFPPEAYENKPITINEAAHGHE